MSSDPAAGAPHPEGCGYRSLLPIHARSFCRFTVGGNAAGSIRAPRLESTSSTEIESKEPLSA